MQFTWRGYGWVVFLAEAADRPESNCPLGSHNLLKRVVVRGSHFFPHVSFDHHDTLHAPRFKNGFCHFLRCHGSIVHVGLADFPELDSFVCLCVVVDSANHCVVSCVDDLRVKLHVWPTVVTDVVKLIWGRNARHKKNEPGLKRVPASQQACYDISHQAVLKGSVSR